MTPISEAPREERLFRALLAIEALVGEGADDNALLGKVFRIAHAGSDWCCARPEWLALIEECEQPNPHYDVAEIMTCRKEREEEECRPSVKVGYPVPPA